ncbi:MAG: 6,7-dimethyl-8-ribityllumazine synthase [Candidatus Omnitrophica bacterium]|nr:6,7-dimethyl-8-ribityllumazine synthase [Candidatus Omnitrophota bacterium]
MQTIQSKNSGKGFRIGIVVSRFNEHITNRLLDGCLDELTKLGVKKNDVTVVWVPGAFEIPLVSVELAKKKNIDAVICLGAIVKGETLHYDLVANESARGIAQASLMTGKPVIFEVLAADTMLLVEKRAQVKGDNKGRDAAKAAVEMIDVMKKIKNAVCSM